METGTSEWTAVMNRLEKLEKQNRRMKQLGVLALILVCSVLPTGKTLTAGYVTDLQVKTVSGTEYLYIKTATYDLSFKATKQLTIYNANGTIKRGPISID